jgi:hypothetical protein
MEESGVFTGRGVYLIYRQSTSYQITRQGTIWQGLFLAEAAKILVIHDPSRGGKLPPCKIADQSFNPDFHTIARGALFHLSFPAKPVPGLNGGRESSSVNL